MDREIGMQADIHTGSCGKIEFLSDPSRLKRQTTYKYADTEIDGRKLLEHAASTTNEVCYV